MKKTTYLLFILTGLLPVFGFAQEIPLFSNYTVNPLIYNPANAGQSSDVQTFLHHRTQWTGFKGSPTSQLLTVSAPLTAINSGIGFSIQNDQRGLFNTLTGSVKYAYHAKLNQQSRLSFGLGLDIQNRLLRIGESTVKDTEDPLVNRGSISETFFDATFGIEYHLLNKLTIGLSVPQLLEGNARGENSVVKNSRYFIGQASYLLNVTSSGDVKIEPVVLSRYSQNVPIQYDVNALLHYKDMFMVGAGYRSNYAVNFHAGIVFKSLTVRYVYDFAAVNSNLNTGLSHEITLGYTLNLNKKEPVVFTEEVPVDTEEPLSKDKIRAILNLLIDEFFEVPNKDLDEMKKIELLRETIFELLDNMNEIK